MLRSGARGGLLTPGFALGALLATFLGGISCIFLPSAPLGAFAIIGAAAFLSSSLAMPVTALFLAYELMNPGIGFVVPLIIAVTGATLARLIITEFESWETKSPIALTHNS